MGHGILSEFYSLHPVISFMRLLPLNPRLEPSNRRVGWGFDSEKSVSMSFGRSLPLDEAHTLTGPSYPETTISILVMFPARSSSAQPAPIQHLSKVACFVGSCRLKKSSFSFRPCSPLSLSDGNTVLCLESCHDTARELR